MRATPLKVYGNSYLKQKIRTQIWERGGTLWNSLCQIEVPCKNCVLKSGQIKLAERCMEVEQEKIDDFNHKINWKVGYDNKFLFFGEFTHHCREVIILFY